MKQTERRSLFGKTYPLFWLPIQTPHPAFAESEIKRHPQPFYRNLIKEIKKTADIPMMTALQRRHSQNSFQTRRPIEPSLVTFLPAFSKNTKEPHYGSSALSHLFGYLQNSCTIPTSTACTTGCFTFRTSLTTTPPRLNLSFNSNAPGIQRKR